MHMSGVTVWESNQLKSRAMATTMNRKKAAVGQVQAIQDRNMIGPLSYTRPRAKPLAM